MKERKLKENWRIVQRMDPDSGRTTSAAEYRGAYLRFPEGTPPAGIRARRPAVCCAVYWLCVLLFLKSARVTGRCFPALMPMLLSLFPGFYAAAGTVSLWKAPERMTVVQKEKGPARIVRSCFGAAILCAAGTIGCVVCLSVRGMWQTAWKECLFPPVCAAAMAAAFTRGRRDLKALGTVPGDVPDK